MNFSKIKIDEKSHMRNINLDGSERKQLEEQMSNIEERGRQKIFTKAAEILSKCPDPDSLEGKTTGLALGKVQSGKTSSFIALTALAFDNDYRIVIVIAGTKNNLLKQTHKRIEKQFNIEGRNDRKIATLTTAEEGLNEKEITAVLESGSNVLITALKHHDHINKISSIFSSPELSNYPTLIIDDEGDQASLNTKNKGKKSTTYREITNLQKTFNLNGFVAYTATPQANLLIKTFDDLFPEFAVLLDPGEGYTGGTTFHGADKEKYMRDIPESDIPLEDNIPYSLEKSLSCFLVGAAIRTLRSDNDIHSMLIHTSRRKNEHLDLGKKMDTLIEKWKAYLKLPKSDNARHKIETKLLVGYKDITNNGNDISYPDWEIVMNQIVAEIKQLRLWTVNSDPNADKVVDRLNLKNNIFIGGNMLERGVTIEGLAVTYITRRAKVSQSDTVEQRARWFGYKKKYLDVCRVFAPKDIREGFSDLLGDEDDLWDSLKQIEEEGTPIGIWPQIIQCSPPFRPTRTNVAATKKFKIIGWTEQRTVELSEEYAFKNVKLIKDFFDDNKSRVEDFGGTKHSVVNDVSLNLLYDSLIMKLENSQANDINYNLIKKIIPKLLKQDNNLTVDVVLMNSGRVREREYEFNKVKQLMQGRNKNYPGDRKIYTDNLSLQFHIIRPNEKKKGAVVSETSAVALNIPESLFEHLGQMVKPSGK